jgi:hypothetical protein
MTDDLAEEGLTRGGDHALSTEGRQIEGPRELQWSVAERRLTRVPHSMMIEAAGRGRSR